MARTGTDLFPSPTRTSPLFGPTPFDPTAERAAKLVDKLPDALRGDATAFLARLSPEQRDGHLAVLEKLGPEMRDMVVARWSTKPAPEPKPARAPLQLPPTSPSSRVVEAIAIGPDQLVSIPSSDTPWSADTGHPTVGDSRVFVSPELAAGRLTWLMLDLETTLGSFAVVQLYAFTGLQADELLSLGDSSPLVKAHDLREHRGVRPLRDGDRLMLRVACGHRDFPTFRSAVLLIERGVSR